MNWVVPQWTLRLLVGISACSIAAGLATERTAWAAERPFTVNLLSSLAGFSSSLAFASVVLNRISRRQYWSAELDRRTRAAMTLERTRRDLATYFDLLHRRAVADQLRERAASLRGRGDSGEDDEAPWMTKPDAYADLEAHVADLVQLEQRLVFVADGELIYRCDRLARKWQAFSEVSSGESDGAEAREPSVDLIFSGIDLAEAFDSLGEWILQAPDRKMKAAVLTQAFRSDLG